jgi:hypothetical protein
MQGATISFKAQPQTGGYAERRLPSEEKPRESRRDVQRDVDCVGR